MMTKERRKKAALVATAVVVDVLMIVALGAFTVSTVVLAHYPVIGGAILLAIVLSIISGTVFVTRRMMRRIPDVRG